MRRNCMDSRRRQRLITFLNTFRFLCIPAAVVCAAQLSEAKVTDIPSAGSTDEVVAEAADTSAAAWSDEIDRVVVTGTRNQTDIRHLSQTVTVLRGDEQVVIPRRCRRRYVPARSQRRFRTSDGPY